MTLTARRLIEFTLRFGRMEGDKHVLDRHESRRLIEALTEQLRLAKRIMDKGGVVVVDGESDTVITTYNVDTPMHGRKAGVRTCAAQRMSGVEAGARRHV